MKTNSVKSALHEGKPQIGTWLSLFSPAAARYMARVGFHWLTLDIEHSAANWETAALIFGAIADAGGVPLARVPANRPEYAKRALDAGAFGLIFPMICSAEEAGQAVAAAKYPPLGQRSVGGGMHALNFETTSAEYYQKANDEILVAIQIEHISAVERCDDILGVPGIDVAFVGPNDLLASMGCRPAMDTDDPQFVEALRTVREAANRHHVAPGIHVGDVELAHKRLAEGWRFIAVASEQGLMLQKASETVKALIDDKDQAAARPY